MTTKVPSTKPGFVIGDQQFPVFKIAWAGLGCEACGDCDGSRACGETGGGARCGGKSFL